MSKLITSILPVIVAGIYFQQYPINLSVKNIAPPPKHTELDHRILFGATPNHLQTDRIHHTIKNHTKNSKYLFFGNEIESNEFTKKMEYLNKNKNVTNKHNYKIIEFNSENTAQHIMNMIVYFIKNHHFNNTKLDNDKDIVYFNLPNVTIYINDFWKDRFMRTFNRIKSMLRFDGLVINSTKLTLHEIKTDSIHKKWLTNLENDIHNQNINSDIEKAKKTKNGKLLFNSI
jgi:hypothetical protein